MSLPVAKLTILMDCTSPAFQELLPVTARAMALAVDYAHGHVISVHCHTHAQLLYAIEGVMTIEAQGGRWVVPPTRGVWLQPGIAHQVRMSGAVKMRTVSVNCANSPLLPGHSCVLDISPLLRQLIVAAVDIAPDFAEGSRDWHLLQLLLHELGSLPVLPLYLPLPVDARLRGICARLMEQPGEQLTVAHWARELACGGKVIDAAMDNGYTSQSTFTAMFKKHFGTTPTAFYQAKVIAA